MQRRPLSTRTSGDETRPAVATDEHGRQYDPRVFAVQRIGALAVAVMSWLAGRTNVAQELRIGEQR